MNTEDLGITIPEDVKNAMEELKSEARPVDQGMTIIFVFSTFFVCE